MQVPFGPYVLIDQLAVGGMAEIFLARKDAHEGFSRDLVVKRILPHLAADQSFVDMFLEEARIASRLSHPNIVHVYDFGAVDGNYYIAMELVRGVDLRTLIATAATQHRSQGEAGAVPPAIAARILSSVCEGLAHAHTLAIDGKPVGLVHRDMTPSNVLLSYDGAVKIADFGIAKAEWKYRSTQTRLGVVKGKHAYMSPEQARGERLDARSDLFNVGILLYESLAGIPLFPQGKFEECLKIIASGELPGHLLLGHVHQELRTIVLRCLAISRDDRYPDALSVRSDLESYLRTHAETVDSLEVARFVKSLFPGEPFPLSPLISLPPPSPKGVATSQPAERTHRVKPNKDADQVAWEDMPTELTARGQERQVTSEALVTGALTSSGYRTDEVSTRVRLPAAKSRRSRRNLWLWASGAAMVLGLVAVVTLIGLKPIIRWWQKTHTAQQTPVRQSSDTQGEVRDAEVGVEGQTETQLPAVSVLSEGISAQLLTAQVKVSSEPMGAEVWVEGSSVGQTPLLLRVPLGGTSIKVSHAGFWDQHIDLNLTHTSQTLQAHFLLESNTLPDDADMP